ncbi:hypothetical protein ACFSBZ_02490 [Amnibacterium flavum]|uniref:Uncharacterized protein n=1 Tax=Amnibacterium flavum TaxID=2173173 RepID=A0A2V1HU81_9MICO|nr:hypothetical protein [Amnibacterium flavum]PVZ94599.1 hypothetical protein DDQ50_12955 [Amnibacterium flavum]
MKRIDIIYDGEQYSVGQRDLDEVKGVIERALAGGGPTWLRVNRGEGRPQPAELLIMPGVPLVLIPLDPDE